MTKKRRNLRILASIIAAGCVWATGMNDAWAADVNANKITADRITLTDGISFEEDNKNYTFDFTIGEIRALRGVYDSTGKILGDDGVVVGLQKHGAGKAIIIDEKGQIKETGSFDTTNTTLFDLMNEYGNVGTFNGFNSDDSWNITPNPEGKGNRDGVGFNPDANGKFETIVANYVGTPNFETNNLAIENAIRLDTSNSDRFGEGAAFNETTGRTDPFKSTIFEANYDYFGVEHYTDTDAGTTSATMKIDDNGTQYTGVVKFGYDVNDNGDMSNIVINAPDRQGIISGLKAGDVTSTSSDAINGAQLYEVINTGIVSKVNDHEWKVANNLNGLGNNNYVTIQDTTLVASDNAVGFDDNGLLTVTVKDTAGNEVTGSANIKAWADNNYAAKTVTINGQEVDVTDQVVNNYTNIQNHETRITNNETKIAENTMVINEHTTQISQITQDISENSNRITNIEKSYVTNVTDNGNDTWTINQTGQNGPVTIKDTYVTGVSHELDASGNLVTTVTQNQGKSAVISNQVKIGNATINYDGDIGTQNNSSIEEAINNNYNKVVNVENNYVSNIVRKDEHTWNVIQGGQVTVTIKDTTLVEKNLFGKDANGNKVSAIDIIVPRALTPDADGNYDAEQVAAYQRELNRNGLVGFVDKNGVPEIVMEFQDTSGNVVQGAVDFAALFTESLQTEAGDNIVVTQKERSLTSCSNLRLLITV